MDVRGRVVRGYRALVGDLQTIRVMAVLASSRPFVIGCTIREDQQRVESVVARASQRNCHCELVWSLDVQLTRLTLSDRLCLAISFVRQKHRWHCQPYTDCKG
jgi:hypothetical protein